MKKFFKQATSVALASAMIFTMAPIASAASDQTGTITPGFDFEGFVNKDVYDITVPTTGQNDLSFTVDPQGLLHVANSTLYTADKGAVYFKTKEDDASTADVDETAYATTSKEFAIMNNSSYSVDVNFDVTVNTEGSGITLAEETALANATKPSLYLGLITKTGSGASAKTETTAVEASTKAKMATLAAVSEVADDTAAGYKLYAMDAATYTTKKAAADAETDADAKKPLLAEIAGYSTTASSMGYHYKYGLTSAYNTTPTGDKVVYQLEGACDSTANWSAIDKTKFTTSIVWKVQKHADSVAPSIASNTFTYSAANGADIVVDLGAGDKAATGIASVQWANTASDTFAAIGGYDTPDFNSSTKTLTLPSGLFGGCQTGGTRAIKITFNDSSSTSVVLTMTKAD